MPQLFASAAAAIANRHHRVAACLLSVACGLVLACSSHPSSPSSASSGRAPSQVKVMSFNIQHGIDGKGRYQLQRSIDTIARVQPDIAGLQEVTRNHPSYACDDQPERIASGLTAATGQRWDVTYQQEWFTPDLSCEQSGRGSGPETEGLAFVTRRSMSPPATVALPGSRIGLEVALRDAYSLPLVQTHLAGGGAMAATRARELDVLLEWAAGFGEPRVLTGDFNARPEDPEVQKVITSYHDAWTDAVRQGRATGSGITHGSARIDYIFYMPGNAMALESAETIDTAALLGVAASDHSPVVATFTVR